MVAVAVQPTPPAARALRALEIGPDDLLINYLPGVLRQDAFLVNFLRIFDSVLRPLIEMIDSVDSYIDPGLGPTPIADWIGLWVGAEVEQSWSEDIRRALIKETVGLHRQRGTAAGLRRALATVTGAEALVIENTPGLRLDADARLGINTTLAAGEPNTIHVTLPQGSDSVDLEAVGDVIRRMKPAHATYAVQITEA